MARPESDKTLLEEATLGIRVACEQIEDFFARLPPDEQLDQHIVYWRLRDSVADPKDRYSNEQREAAAEELSQLAYLMRHDPPRDADGNLADFSDHLLGYFGMHAWVELRDARGLDEQEPAQADAVADALDEAASWVLAGWSPGDEWTGLDLEWDDLCDALDAADTAIVTAYGNGDTSGAVSQPLTSEADVQRALDNLRSDDPVTAIEAAASLLDTMNAAPPAPVVDSASDADEVDLHSQIVSAVYADAEAEAPPPADEAAP